MRTWINQSVWILLASLASVHSAIAIQRLDGNPAAIDPTTSVNIVQQQVVIDGRLRPGPTGSGTLIQNANPELTDRLILSSAHVHPTVGVEFFGPFGAQIPALGIRHPDPWSPGSPNDISLLLLDTPFLGASPATSRCWTALEAHAEFPRLGSACSRQ